MNRMTNERYLARILATSVVATVALSGCSEPYRTHQASTAEGPQEVRQERFVRSTLQVSQDSASQTTDGEFIGRQSVNVMNSACVGYVDNEPSFSFEIVGDQPIDTVVQLTDAAGIDAVLFVQGPNASYCIDDGGEGLLPRMTESFAPGRYLAFAGAYTQNQGAKFVAEIMPEPPKFQVSDCRPEQTVTIGPGFSMQRINGSFDSAPRDCTGSFDISCSGSFPDEVATCIEVTAPVPARIRLTSAPFDTVMVLQAENHSPTLYDDDSAANQNSEIMTVLQPGTYALHVGGYGDDARGPWTGEIRPVNIALNENGEFEPQEAESCRELPADETVSFIGTAKPEIACSILFPNGACSGSIPTVASHCIEVTESASVSASITEGGFDSVMVITGEDVFLYNDDSNEGLLSTIDSPLPAGRYQVFVGSLDAAESAPYRLEVTSERGVGE